MTSPRSQSPEAAEPLFGPIFLTPEPTVFMTALRVKPVLLYGDMLLHFFHVISVLLSFSLSTWAPAYSPGTYLVKKVVGYQPNQRSL